MNHLSRLLPLAALVFSFSIPAVCSASLADDGGSDPQKSTVKKKKAGNVDDEDFVAEQSRGFRLGFEHHPIMQMGGWLRLDFKIKVQTDFRAFDPDLTTVGGCDAWANNTGCLFDLHRARIDLKGRLFKDFVFEVEREFKSTSRPLFIITGPTTVRQLEVSDPWRDVYVDYRRFKKFSLQVGKFKLPFSLDQFSGDTERDFIRRSRLGDQLGPDRDLGIMLHGRFFSKGLYYQFGLFRHDGNNSHLSGHEAYLLENPATAERTFAGRVTGRPFRLVPVPKLFKNVELGGAFTSGVLINQQGGLRSRTTSDETLFPRMFVNGERRRLGAELNWLAGPFGVQGEFARVSEERIKQALSGGDLPDLLVHAWYLSGSWLLTGEKKGKGLEPKRPFRSWLLWGGPGAVELVVRYEQLRNSSDTHDGRPSRSLRAANVLQQSDRVWTFGTNWYLNGFTKVQYNAYRERIEDIQRSPVPGMDLLWSHVLRIQFEM